MCFVLLFAVAMCFRRSGQPLYAVAHSTECSNGVLMTCVGRMLLLKSGDVEENPGPLTEGDLSASMSNNN